MANIYNKIHITYNMIIRITFYMYALRELQYITVVLTAFKNKESLRLLFFLSNLCVQKKDICIIRLL